MDLNYTFYHPIVGSKYENGIKLLILGESHYCNEGCDLCGIKSGYDCSQFTIEVLKRYVDYKNGNGNHESWMTTFKLY
ncbi:hypothetical protein [Chryseobacterium sp. JM1]|uniref:hypothetical protein n=1 Tax=Chryseobacterium sp. JM1 TaxID=1233950 RepID=UPI0004E6D06D|nr:hypothetical protein [Chryseobacterium sp. JM1]KFF15726.1 hypothetical protein IW22_23700 [Chryseobacterium sp. JM1]